jgi:hypothetical protein
MSAARVTSIEAVREFKASLQIYCEHAKDALSSVEMESRRMLDWIGREQLGYWQRAVRARQDEVSQAKADLFRKRLPAAHGDQPDCIEEKKAVRVAQMRLEEAEEKVEKCREWARQLPRAIEEYTGFAHQLAAMVEGDFPTPVAHLDKIIASLHAYTDLIAPAGSSARPAPSAAPAPASAPGAPAAEKSASPQ